jgi:hypothetical protein
LFVLAVRVFALPEPIVLPESPHFAGCRSWVDFPQALPTARLRPVLPDDHHRERMSQIRRALATRVV